MRAIRVIPGCAVSFALVAAVAHAGDVIVEVGGGPCAYRSRFRTEGSTRANAEEKLLRPAMSSAKRSPG